ncbi:MAG: ROK family transcriptional regulator [Ruminiclostridium sp.]
MEHQILTQDQSNMKLNNLRAIFQILSDRSPISRADIAKISGMSPTSITRFINDMSLENLILETSSAVKKVGRTATLMTINSDFCYSVGINIDSNYLHVSLLDFNKHVVGYSYNKLNSPYPGTVEIVDNGYQLYQNVLKQNGILSEKVIGLGVSIVGIIDYEHILAFVPQFKWESVDLYNMLHEKFNLENIIIENDCNSAVIGECVKNPRYRQQTVAFIGLGTGVGSSLCINGELFNQGSRFTLSEIGHTTVDPNGILCDCGRVGCLQTYIAEGALVIRAQQADPSIQSLDDIYKAWCAQVSWALELIQQSCTYIKIAINNIACLYNPHTILLGGDLVDHYWDMFQTVLECQDKIFKALQNKIEIIPLLNMYQSSILGISARVQQIYLNNVFKNIISK